MSVSDLVNQIHWARQTMNKYPMGSEMWWHALFMLGEAERELESASKMRMAESNQSTP